MTAFYEPRAALIDHEDGYTTSITAEVETDPDTGVITLRLRMLVDSKRDSLGVSPHQWHTFYRAVRDMIVRARREQKYERVRRAVVEEP